MTRGLRRLVLVSILGISFPGMVVDAAGADPGKGKPKAEPPPRLKLRDITASSGVNFSGPFSKEKRYILESVSGGVALVDFNRDGLLDIFLVGSSTVDRMGRNASVPSALYRNDGNLKFTDVAKASGVSGTGWGVGVCAADVNGDGFTDLYVTGVGENQLFLNQKGRSFQEVAQAAGVKGGGWSTGCSFADYDRDGDLDLFVARYLDMDMENLPKFGEGDLCKYREIPVQCGPRGLKGQTDLLFRNDGETRFTEVSTAAGVHDKARLYGLGVSFFDVDGDGWQDLYVANDTKPNYLYLNKKDGTFEDMSYLMGVAVSEDGREQGSMGIALGDYRNEGRLSLFVTNFSEEYNAFFRNEGGEYFSDVSFATKTAGISVRHVGWGTSFFDVDNDGWLDLILANGHVYPQMDEINLEASAPYKQRRMLFRNLKNGTFEDVIDAGSPLSEKTVSRGLAVGDLDNDGRLDVVISDLDGKAQVLRNETDTKGHWLQVRLEGKGKNRDAVGAVIKLRAGSQSLLRTVRSGTSYLSQDDLRRHFGLGSTSVIDVVEVIWPDGSTSKKKKVKPDQVLVMTQP